MKDENPRFAGKAEAKPGLIVTDGYLNKPYGVIVRVQHDGDTAILVGPDGIVWTQGIDMIRRDFPPAGGLFDTIAPAIAAAFGKHPETAMYAAGKTAPDPTIDLTPEGEADAEAKPVPPQSAMDALLASADGIFINRLAYEAIILRAGLCEILDIEDEESPSAFVLVDSMRQIDADAEEADGLVDRMRKALNSIEGMHCAESGETPGSGSCEDIVQHVRNAYVRLKGLKAAVAAIEKDAK